MGLCILQAIIYSLCSFLFPSFHISSLSLLFPQHKFTCLAVLFIHSQPAIADEVIPFIRLQIYHHNPTQKPRPAGVVMPNTNVLNVAHIKGRGQKEGVLTSTLKWIPASVFQSSRLTIIFVTIHNDTNFRLGASVTAHARP